MKVIDSGFYLGSKKYGENSSITFILSKENGLVKGFTRFTKKDPNVYSALDKINFEWYSKNSDGLGFLKINLSESSKKGINDFLFELIKASVSELCLKCLPVWQTNNEIFKDIEILLDLQSLELSNILIKYVWWEVLFLKNTGYGLNLDTCAVSGSSENIFFISPKSGNSVSFNIGKKYEKKLFKIPRCFKEIDDKSELNDCLEGLKITGYFLKKNFEKKYSSFIFRNELLKKLKKF